MTTNRDAALNTVYPSKYLANNAIGALFDADEITWDEWLYAHPQVALGGWMIHLQ
jgi:hypothetical protein